MHQTDPSFQHLRLSDVVEGALFTPSGLAPIYPKESRKGASLLRPPLATPNQPFHGESNAAKPSRPKETTLCGRSPVFPKDFQLVPVPSIFYAGGMKPEVLMDPIAALRQCIRYFCSHPEVYGTDLQDLLWREVCYVMELKAAEISLIEGKARFNKACEGSGDDVLAKPRGRLKKNTTPSRISALPKISCTLQPRGREGRKCHKRVEDSSDTSGTFGYADVSFMPALQGFEELLRKTVIRERREESGAADQLLAGEADKVLPIHMWNVLHEAMRKENEARVVCWEDGAGGSAGTDHFGSKGIATLSHLDAEARNLKGTLHLHSEFVITPNKRSENLKPEAISREKDAVSPRFDSLNKRSSKISSHENMAELVSPRHENVDAYDRAKKDILTSPPVGSPFSHRCFLIDTGGYEISYLRRQISQLEAVYNSKCIQVHELLEDNQALNAKLVEAQNEVARWKSAHQSVREQLKASKKEMESWMSHASDMNAVSTCHLSSTLMPGLHSDRTLLNSTTSDPRQVVQAESDVSTNYPQLLHEANEEIAQLNALWRETERAMQELRRAFENSENEANQTLNHISDAFFYIERLERRVARRDAYINLTAQRQASLEEKYEKLMWCCQELGTFSGTMSYADYLLANHPVWSRLLFIRLQRHAVGYRFLSPTPDSLKRFYKGGNLIFVQTPKGSVLMDTILNPSVVYTHVCNALEMEKDGVSQRRNVRASRASVSRVSCCRALRWRNPFVIDYLNLDSVDAALLNPEHLKARLPLLTAASLLFPLQTPCAPCLMSNTVSKDDIAGKNDTFASEKFPFDPSAAAAMLNENLILPNSREFGQSTIRFLLRSFWQQRLYEYKQNMRSRLRDCIEMGKGQAFSTSGNYHTYSSVVSEDLRCDDLKMKSEETSSAPTTNKPDEKQSLKTFLSALIDFSMRVLDEQEYSRNSLARKATIPFMKTTRTGYTVHGTFAQNEKDVWNDGRIFFAVVLKGNLASKVEAKDQPLEQATPVSAAPANFMYSENEVISQLPKRVREFLTSLYYFTMEFKDSDADFRLFYLVSHQLIPEVVGVNFFASLEALEKNCCASLIANVNPIEDISSPLSSKRDSHKCRRKTNEALSEPLRSTGEINQDICSPSAMSAAVNTTDSDSEWQEDQKQTVLHFNESPIEALQRVLSIVDQAELVGEREEIEYDSDAEGYGSVFPPAKDQHIPKKVSRSHQTQSPLTSITYAHLPSTQAIDYGGNTEQAKANVSVDSESAFRRNEISAEKLKHNIRDYLRKIYREKKIQDVPAAFRWTEEEDEKVDESKQKKEETEKDVQEEQHGCLSLTHFPQEWTELDHQIRNAIGPHSSLIAHFKAKEPSLFGVMREKRFRFNQIHTQQLAAARGLLSLNELLDILKRHCFTTYAVSCLGSPRFPLLDVFSAIDIKPSGFQFDALYPIGQLPPADIHLQRLRFALALDQPGSLIDPRRLFAFDSYTSNPTHFYDEYLTLTLDLFTQQQQWFIDVIQRSCAARHSRFVTEGAGDCDGDIPIACLKRGFHAAFGKLGLGNTESNSFVDHLVSYNKQFCSQDLIRAEQFTEAIWLVERTELRSNAELRDLRSSGSARKHEKVDRWNLWEESEVCSMLNLALALRSSYIVWGKKASKAAKLFVSYAGYLPIRPVRVGHQSTIDLKTPLPMGLLLNSSPQPSEHLRGSSTHGNTAGADEELSQSQLDALNWEAFENDINETYAWTLECIRNAKTNGMGNPLRRILIESKQEAAASVEELQKFSIASTKSDTNRAARLPAGLDIASSKGGRTVSPRASNRLMSNSTPSSENIEAAPITTPSFQIGNGGEMASSRDVVQDSSLYALGDILGLAAMWSLSTPLSALTTSSMKSKAKKRNKGKADGGSSLQSILGTLFQENLLSLQRLQEVRLCRLIASCDSFSIHEPQLPLVSSENLKEAALAAQGETQRRLLRSKSFTRASSVDERRSSIRSGASRSRKKAASRDMNVCYPDSGWLPTMEELFNGDALSLPPNAQFKLDQRMSNPRKLVTKPSQVELSEPKTAEEEDEKIPALCVPHFRVACAALSLI